jgi:A/G-specific adenine glycosylase
MNRAERTQVFVETIRQWYSRHKRELPWRDLQMSDDTERAYQVLVSEIMLQQTQVPRVIVTFKNFLRTFPTLASLAAASNREILIAWRGMGYNSRALRLRDAAAVISNCGGGRGVACYAPTMSIVFPTSMEKLMSIPGIGHYTAAAIRNFAFNIPTPCIDTNIRRILHRTFVGPEKSDGTWGKGDEYLLKIAAEVLVTALNHQMTTADWHAALMDFGSLVQTKKNPKWDICPLTKKGICKTTQRMFERTRDASVPSEKKQEPGRLVGSTFVPNRIFRGRIVEALRDAQDGLTAEEIGRMIAVDYSRREHDEWLRGVIQSLIKDKMVRAEKLAFVLS